MSKEYNHKKIENKWQKKWRADKVYQDYSRSKKFYALDMFPYPSGAGLHVGHPKGYIATDIVARMKLMQGYSVLHPMGWDAFGLPAENYALKTKTQPSVAVKKNITIFKKQLELFGFTYDWDKEINTTNPEYYKWTQWIFLKMFEKGLAYESNEPVNWCPSCKTVLANEDLEVGKCERCGSAVVQKKMRQWVLKMTDYADRLLDDLNSEDLDWEDMITEQQRNWIGRSEGAIIKFKINNSKLVLEVFTTRVDTIFGCTYCVVAPEHQIISDLKSQISNFSEVEKYIEKSTKKTELERMETKDKSGVEIKGIKVVNPFNNEELPLFVADYVLAQYGTGAVMAVPAHDERDWEFAQKYNIKKIKVIENIDEKEDLEKAFIEDGRLIESGDYANLTSQEAREEMSKWLGKNNLGNKKINYKIRDWVFSRQRYWGEPIPIIHCGKCGAVGVPEKDLPVELPAVKSYEPTGTGESPLANIISWVNTNCPKCGGEAKRETNTMPQWAGSCWYYLRYIDSNNKEALVDKEAEKEWMPVDLYVGGAEHAARHLLYARFWHKFLFDIDVVSTTEPFKRFIHVGLINGEDGRKMSKRWGNVVNPDDMIERFGADAVRLYEMFMGPFTQNIAWSTDGLVGTKRFLEKVWRTQDNVGDAKSLIESLMHKTIKKVSEDIENFRFNTAISQMMILINEMEGQEKVAKEDLKLFIMLLAPFAPHMAEEIWHNLGEKGSIFLATWPEYDKKLLLEEQIEIVVQINGRMRGTVESKRGTNQAEIEKKVRASEKFHKWLAGQETKKIIYISDRLINFLF